MPSANIASGGSLSGAVELPKAPGTKIVGFVMPDTWDAADLSFQASADGTTYQNVFDDNDAELVVQAAASRAVGLRKDASDVLGRWAFIKVRSGAAGAPVTQTAARTIQVAVK